MNDSSRKAVAAALVANLGIGVAKLVGFAITGSAGMAAEAVHSFADTGNQGLLFLGGTRASRERDAEHPFGHERERFFWGFIVSLVLFSFGGLFALNEGIQKLRHPHDTDNVLVAVAILFIAIVLEGTSLRTALREISHVKPKSMSYWRFIRTAKNPELPTVLLEDVAAETGLIVALLGLLMAHVTHNARWDAAGSVVIGVLLIAVACILAVEMKSLLLGEPASPEMAKALHEALLGSEHVMAVVYLHTEHVGPDTLLVATKAIFSPSLPSGDLARAIDTAEEAMRAAVPAAKYIFVEPDVARPAL
jgi:cation diffusion facilitator family transporter